MLETSLLVLGAMLASLSDIPNPRPSGWVSDQAQVLDERTEATLNQLADQLRATRQLELAIVTVDDVRGTPKAFARELLRTWGIGSADTHNGALLLIVIGRRRIEIVTGRGIEGALPAAWLAELEARVLVPRFRARDYGRGLVEGVLEIANHLASRVAADDKGDGFPLAEVLFGAFGLSLAGVLVRRHQRRRTCYECQPPRRMGTLARSETTAHLTLGEQTEQRLGAVDHEVIQCPGCHAVRKFPHRGAAAASYANCPACSHRAVTQSSTTAKAATYDHGGELEETPQCDYSNDSSSDFGGGDSDSDSDGGAAGSDW